MSAKELLNLYLNQTKSSPELISTVNELQQSTTPSTIIENLPDPQVVDQLLPILGFLLYLALRLVGSCLSWINRWKLFRKYKKTGIVHSLYYTLTASTGSGENFNRNKWETLP